MYSVAELSRYLSVSTLSSQPSYVHGSLIVRHRLLLPTDCYQSGIGMYLVLLVVYAILCDFTLMLCYDLATRHNLTSYAECCHFAFGKPGYLFASVRTSPEPMTSDIVKCCSLIDALLNGLACRL